MSYIVRLKVSKENRFLIRKGHDNITVLGTKPGGAARFNTIDEAKKAAEYSLPGFTYDIVEIQ